jgi:hypothetical protein
MVDADRLQPLSQAEQLRCVDTGAGPAGIDEAAVRRVVGE